MIKIKRLSIILSIMAISLSFSLYTNAATKHNKQEDTFYIDYGLINSLNFPYASCIDIKANDKAIIDYTNCNQGYVMLKYNKATKRRLKAQVEFLGSEQVYTYDIQPEVWETLPLSEGNGEYKITIYEHLIHTKYLVVLQTNIDVELDDELLPFLWSTKYINYEIAGKSVTKAAELTAGATSDLEKVKKIYEYIITHIDYDNEKAKNVKSGYVPNLDNTLETGKGICFDYAALTAGMLRSQNIPCKLIMGYNGEIYHAWISVWTEDTSWIDKAIYYNKDSWHRMDPTFGASGYNDKFVNEYVNNEENYIELKKY